VRYIFILFIALTCLINSFAQKITVTSEILSTKQIAELFPDTVRKTLNINFPIFKVYRYSDKSGQYFCILTESKNAITADKDTFNHKVKAINVKADNDSFTKIWEINDNIIKNEYDETSILFSTKYTEIKDYDGDGLADPVITYSTSAANGLDDGRIKIVIYYKGQKVAVRHQNAVLDFERKTQVDKAFYELPKSLQTSIKRKMEQMVKSNHAIFPAGWQTAMKNKKTTFNERR
jgi:hypothetical protein